MNTEVAENPLENVELLTRAYVQLRDKRSEIKKAFDEQDQAIKTKMEKIEVNLMRKLGEFNVESVKTPYGTVFKATETRYTCSQWGEFWSWCRDNDRLDCLEKRVSQGAMRDLLTEEKEEAGTLPPGIDVHTERVVRVRRG